MCGGALQNTMRIVIKTLQGSRGGGVLKIGENSEADYVDDPMLVTCDILDSQLLLCFLSELVGHVHDTDDEGWNRTGDTGYRFIYDMLLNYQAARDFCQNLNGHLVYMETEDEYQTVVQLLNDSPGKCY